MLTAATKALLVFVIVFHLAAFALEAVFWMQPAVYGFALSRVTDANTLDPQQQALVLRALFVNQGFYNLFLACAGGYGLRLLARGNTAAGYALVTCMCAFALGAGIVLAATTRAYVGAVFQSLPAAIALSMLARRRG
jgi:putative membrane protein